MKKEEREGWSYCRDTDIAIVVGLESVVADYMRDSPSWVDDEGNDNPISMKDLNTDELMQDVWDSPTAEEKCRVLQVAFRMTDKDILQWGKNSVYRPRENIVEVTYSDAIRIIEMIDAEIRDIYSGKWNGLYPDMSSDERKCELLTLRHAIVDKVDMSRLNTHSHARDLMAYSTQREGQYDTKDGQHGNVHGEL